MKRGLVVGLLFTLVACGQQEASLPSAEALTVIDAAIAAHGGLEELRAASTWVAEVRRHQRGESYVLTNRYRPGMVRLESDMGNGERSADVIGDSHCWGMHGPVSMGCSPETRENDRPRVIMEMAAQLWPLVGEDWELLGAYQAEVEGETLDVVTARYLPRDTEAEFGFDGATHRLRRISIRGVKGGVEGTHLHVYSDLREHCGVLMPFHNVKSFEGEVWVEEDILELSCEPVPESLFVRPPRVPEGTIVAGEGVLSIFSFEPHDESSSTLEEALRAEAAKRGLEASGPIRIEQHDNDGMGLTGELIVELQLSVGGR